ncbi:lamin tail domain-containing protein [Paraliomyxa miuraensis]|uniref:lamin tail domain-containing protein n=1 Tax=Paraliomyxa miuraensis TaxID=376150 RepID=UPI00224D9843|nr:hypothetical protein [Paraliomyxa miuraensis]MCX4246316.1 hypothetical protein [Paraliomyxa miuraensis]
MDRVKLCFLLATCPLLACTDVPEVPVVDDSSTGDESTTGTVTVTPTTMTTTTADSSTTDATTGVDSTGSESDSSSSSDSGSSSSSDSGSSSSSGETTGGVCGNDDQDPGEQCDGTDLAGYNCVTLGMGFTGGELACAADCTFDTSACLACGNDMIDAGEDCDGADLGGNDCASVGFVDGTLACAADCTFDTTSCNACGNGVVDAGESCDGADLGGMGCADLGMGFTGGALGCDMACGYDTTGCTNLPWPVAGEVIITEIMQNPQVLLDADGEWFEVFNPTMGTVFQLGTCTFEGAADLGFTIDVDLTIGPMEYRTFAVQSMVDQGFVADYQWPPMQYNLTNTSDTVRLTCGGVIVDEVSYDDGATFPDPNGQSMSLDPSSYDAVLNDDGTNWCAGSQSYNGDFGTPGTANPVCMGPASYPIDFCRLQFPTLVDEPEGTDVDVFGRVFIGGLTDISGVNDPAPEVIGYVGHGPDGTDPAIDPGWVWTAGVPNAGYGPASPGYEANNDEYHAVLSVPSPPGSYDFAFRFSGDGGATFTYCDGQPAGNSDGYQPANAGQMTSQPGAPPPPMFFSEYAEGSSNNKALEVYNPSGVAADLTSCEIRFYFNGAMAATTTIPLGGMLAADDVLVVCDDSIDAAVFAPMNCDVLAAGTFYNGDDAIELACSGVTLDVIGQIGFDPGAEWLVGGVGTQDETLRRSCTVATGDANGFDVFDPSLEWASFPQNTFADFGQHICP